MATYRFAVPITGFVIVEVDADSEAAAKNAFVEGGGDYVGPPDFDMCDDGDSWELLNVSDDSDYLSLEDCITSGSHLADCDDDGYCNACGFQD